MSSGGKNRSKEEDWEALVNVAAAGLFPLALGAPHVLVFHAVDLAALAAFRAYPPVKW